MRSGNVHKRDLHTTRTFLHKYTDFYFCGSNWWLTLHSVWLHWHVQHFYRESFSIDWLFYGTHSRTTYNHSWCTSCLWGSGKQASCDSWPENCRRIWSAGSMFPVLDRFWSTRHQYGTEVFLGNRPLLLRESKPVLHGEFWKHPGEHQSKYYLRDSNGHPSFGGAVFRLHVCYIHSCTTPQAHSINDFSLLPNPLVHTTYASPVSWFSQEYALLATCILSSITQLFFGILFHTHCSRYPIMLNSAEPYLITGKNTNTNLFSTCNTHPLPPPLH